MDENLKLPRISRQISILIWSGITLIFFIYFLVVLYLDFTQMLVPCEGLGCNFLALSGSEAAALASWGLSLPAYAYYMCALTVFFTIVYWALGGIIAWRQGSTPGDLVVSLALIVIPISTYGGSTDWATNYPSLAIPGTILNGLGTFIIILFFYLIPNGRFSSRWAYIPFGMTIFLLTLLGSQTNGFLSSDLAQSLIGAATVGFVIIGGIFQVFRYKRNSSLLERQQTKWILFGVLTYILSVVVWVLIFGRALDIPAGNWRLLAMLGGWFLVIVTLLGLPAAITVSILRYRLWDIDLVIRRTLQYSVVTAFLGMIYLGGVTLLQSLFVTFSGQQSAAAVVISTLLMAALFNPLRYRLQDMIDRRFYRQKYDAQKALAEFAAAARSETDLERLSNHLTTTVQESLQPQQVNLWLMPENSERQG